MSARLRFITYLRVTIIKRVCLTNNNPRIHTQRSLDYSILFCAKLLAFYLSWASFLLLQSIHLYIIISWSFLCTNNLKWSSIFPPIFDKFHWSWEADKDEKYKDTLQCINNIEESRRRFIVEWNYFENPIHCHDER